MERYKECSSQNKMCFKVVSSFSKLQDMNFKRILFIIPGFCKALFRIND